MKSIWAASVKGMVKLYNGSMLFLRYVYSREVKLFWELTIDSSVYRVEYLFEDWNYVQDRILINGDPIFETETNWHGVERPYTFRFEINGRKSAVFVYREIQYMTAELYCDGTLMKPGEMNLVPLRDEKFK